MSFDDLVSDKYQDIVDQFEDLQHRTDEFVEDLKYQMNESVDDITNKYKKALDILLDDCKKLHENNHNLKQILNQHNIPHTTVEVI